MAAKNEMTITVRAVDAATAVLSKIGAGVTLFGKKVGSVFGNIIKSTLNWKAALATLLGGGLIGGLINRFGALTNSLAKNAKQYEAAFSPQQQTRIDGVASAYNRFAASLKATFGTIVANFGEKIAKGLDGLSDWLRDNNKKIIKFVEDLGGGIKKALKHTKDAVEWWKGVGEKKPVSSPVAISDEEIEKLRQASIAADAMADSLKKWDAAAKGVLDNVKTGEITTEYNNWQAAATASEKAANAAKVAYEAYASAVNGASVTVVDETAAGLDQANDSLVKQSNVLKTATISWATWGAAADRAAEAAGRIREHIAQISDVMTDRTLEAIDALIDGTKNLETAFKDMVGSILRDLLRLELRAQLSKLFTSLLSSVAGGGGGGGGGATISYPSATTYAGSGATSPASAPSFQSFAPPVVNVTIVGNTNPGKVQKEVEAAVIRALATSRNVRQKVRMA